MENLLGEVKRLASQYAEDIVEIRRYIHRRPELSFKEYETSKYISKKLDEYGIDHHKGVVETGIVAFVKGKNPDSNTIALRADIDALPIQETNTMDYKSLNDGIMHACGHDVHTASLLGVVRILNELKEEIEGTVKFIFQPGEEKLPGGAKLMIEEGVLENPVPKSMLGQHVYPDVECGKVGFKSGMYMASADEIYVTVKGKGGHAALPHLNVDPILITSHIITSLQQLVSRNSKPTVPTVLSFGKVIGNGATNVIPDVVTMEGTFRTMDEEWREMAHKKMKKMAEDIAHGMGGECDFKIEKGYPFLTNDDTVTNLAKSSAVEYLGEENVIDLDLRMTAEDFAYFSQVVPSCFYRLGTRNASKNISSGLHTSTFNVDENALEIGMGLMAWLAIKELKR